MLTDAKNQLTISFYLLWYGNFYFCVMDSVINTIKKIPMTPKWIFYGTWLQNSKHWWNVHPTNRHTHAWLSPQTLNQHLLREVCLPLKERWPMTPALLYLTSGKGEANKLRSVLWKVLLWRDIILLRAHSVCVEWGDKKTINQFLWTDLDTRIAVTMETTAHAGG